MRKLLVLLLLTSCTDPVRDAEITKLGPEVPGVPVGAEHRPGQPCLVCHSEGGPASSKAFAMAGTVYATNEPGAEGAEGITIGLVDSTGGAPAAFPSTGPSGNFYIPIADWPIGKLKFPVRVALYKEDDNGGLGAPLIVMKSLIGREGSCNYCHRPNPPDDATDEEIDDSVSSAGQIYLQLGTAK
jgi:hypothetical protein